MVIQWHSFVSTFFFSSDCNIFKWLNITVEIFTWWGTDLGRGYRDVQPWRLPFLVVHKRPISSNSQFTSPFPLLRKKCIISTIKTSSFALILALKPPNLEIFSSQDPSFRGNDQFISPTLWKSRPHTPTWKKVASPGIHMLSFVTGLMRWEIYLCLLLWIDILKLILL